MRKLYLLIGASLLVFSSCKKDRVQVNTTANANPVIAVPIGEANLTLEHIIDPNDPNDTLISQNNGLYQVVLAQENVVDQALTDLISLPAQNLVNQSVKMGTVPVDSFGVSESVSLNDLIDDLGSSAQSGLNVSLDDIQATQAISMQGIIDTAGGSLQSSLSIDDISTSQSISLDDLMSNGGGLASNFTVSDFTSNQSVSLDDILASGGSSLSSSLTISDFNNSQSVTLDDLASTGGGALASSLSISDFSSNQDITLESISTSIGGSFASALSVSDVSESQDITLGQIASDAGLTAINTANGATAPFPPLNESNVGPYSGGSLGNFTDVTLSAGDLTLTVTNNWPVPMNMDIDLINTADNSVIFSYTFLNIPANGGTDSETKSLIGETLPSTMGFLMTSISSPGSGFTPVVIDTSDAITMDIATVGMVASSYNAPFPSVNQSNVGTYGSGGSLGTFDNATFSQGDLTLSFTNNWPVAMSMDVDVVDTLTNATILSYSFNNISGNGGTSSQSKSLIGITLPSTMGLQISSVNSAGSGSSSVPIDLQDNITLGISGTNMEASSLNAPFPSVNQTNLGTFSGGNLGSFTNVTLSAGDLALSITNNWPVPMSLGIDIVDTITGSTILTYNFSNVSANGGTDSKSESLVGVTLPASMGFKITSVSSPGSGTNSVSIDVQDEITFGISGSNLQASSLNAAFPSVNLTDVGTYGAGGSLGNVENVTFSDGSLALSLTNDWPITLSMGVDIVDTLTNTTILSYSFTNVTSNGGTSSQSKSLDGVTLPASMGMKISSVSSPGSGGTSVPIDLLDAITFGISGTNMKASSVTAPFPAISESNVGTYNSPSLGSFTDVTFSDGSLALSLTNNWPIDLSVDINLVNTATNTTIVSYSLNNVSAGGGSVSQSQSMAGITLPSTLGFEIVSVSSPGSPSTPVLINVSDEIDLGVTSSGLKASQFTGTFPTINESDIGTFNADSLGNFTSASFSSGDLSIGLTNNWPVDLSMTIDLVNSITDSTILTYTFANVTANGGSNIQTNSLAGVTLPSTLGFKVVTVSSPGSPNTTITVDLSDEIILDISGDNLQAASFIGPFPVINATNAGVFNAPTLSMFSSASFSSGNLDMTLKNDWPIELSMSIELINTATSSTILSYNFNNVTGNGGTNTQTNSLAGVTLPNTLGVSIASVSSPGSPNTAINIDLMDEIEFTLSGTGLEVYNAIVELDTMAITDQKQVVDLGIAGVEINTIAFNTGDLDYDFTSTIPADVEITLAFPSTDKNGAPVDTTILVVANQSTTGTISLNSTLFDLTTDTVQDHSRMPVELSATLLGTAGQVQVDSSQGLSVKFDMDNIDFNYIEGYFGDTAVTFPSDNIALNIDFLDQFQGEITFEDPTLDINITSNIGMPMELDLDFSAFRNGTEYPLNGPKQILPYPSNVGDSATGSVFYDNTNSTITDVFTLPFDSISYGGSITINPDTATYGKYNFVTSDARVTGDLLLELPFTFSTAGISLTQVLDSNLNLESQLDTSAFYEIEYAKLIIIATSTLPVDAVVDLNFYDDSGNLVLKKSLPILESGVPNSNGVVVMPNTLNAELVITETEFDDLIQARVVEAEATVISYNNGGTPVKLRTDATVGLAIGLEAKLKVEL